MTTLDSFYRSKEWRKLVKNIKLERLNERGQVICSHCGKPIVHEYDCIGHHIKYLTHENVNDPLIALNPDNVELVHHRCHNLIHKKMEHKERQVYLVYGPPLAGKTTYVNSIMNRGDLIVDMDLIWQCVSGLDRYDKPPRLNAVAFTVRDSLIDAVRYRRGKWTNAYIIGGYPYEGERERLVKDLGAREVFVSATKEECLTRLQATEDGRDKKEWTRFIQQWFDRSPPLCNSEGC